MDLKYIYIKNSRESYAGQLKVFLENLLTSSESIQSQKKKKKLQNPANNICHQSSLFHHSKLTNAEHSSVFELKPRFFLMCLLLGWVLEAGWNASVSLNSFKLL